MRCLLFFTLCLGSLFHGNSQTCCSANTPLTGTLDLLPGNGENGYLMLQFDYKIYMIISTEQVRFEHPQTKEFPNQLYLKWAIILLPVWVSLF